MGNTQLPHPRPAICWTAMAVGLALFGLLAVDLSLHGPITRADPAVSGWFHARMTPALTYALLAVTHLHSTLGICIVAALAGAMLLTTRQTAWLPMLVMSMPGGLAVNASLKQLFGRARPQFDHPLLMLSSSSFPSGHTAGATV